MHAPTAEPLISTPVYRQPTDTQQASRCLVVSQLLDDTLQAWLDSLHTQDTPCTLIAPVGCADGLAAFEYADVEHLPQALDSALQQAGIGLRLYVYGDETFLWQVHALACQAGLLDEEIELLCCGEQRLLYCVHCSHLQPIGRQQQVRCSGCGVGLLVREHFSRRLGAYMGVCLDPDQPLAEVG